MDEFSWFVGLFEGEGCYYYENNCGVIQIDMTDEDTIIRVSKFLGVSYRKLNSRNEKHKTIWRVRARGGLTRGKHYNLINKMLPYLSNRRQETIKKVWNMKLLPS